MYTRVRCRVQHPFSQIIIVRVGFTIDGRGWWRRRRRRCRGRRRRQRRPCGGRSALVVIKTPLVCRFSCRSGWELRVEASARCELRPAQQPSELLGCLQFDGGGSGGGGGGGLFDACAVVHELVAWAGAGGGSEAETSAERRRNGWQHSELSSQRISAAPGRRWQPAELRRRCSAGNAQAICRSERVLPAGEIERTDRDPVLSRRSISLDPCRSLPCRSGDAEVMLHRFSAWSLVSQSSESPMLPLARSRI